MGVLILIGFLFFILVLAVIKTNIKLNKEEKSLENKNNNHHNLMIF